jgi:uncharacterized membrane protein
MDDRIRKRILMFYFAGFFNLALGLYVLINGRSMLEPGMWITLVVFFFGFAAVDFWFPRVLKKRWREAQARLDAKDEGGRMKDERGKAQGS